MVMTPDFSREKMPLAMTASLSLVAKSHTIRCDARQAEKRFAEFEVFISSVEHFYLGDFLPNAFVKGKQPQYIESLEPSGVPVINTLAIQQLSIRVEECRFITQEDYDALDDERKPKKNDVLLTVDGGPSIGKPVSFDLEEDYAIDSHIAILRPVSLDPKWLVYLLASPLGQVQFQQAESGASGQTGVTEEDVRRFRFPVIKEQDIEQILGDLDRERAKIVELASTMREAEERAWGEFNLGIASKARRI